MSYVIPLKMSREEREKLNKQVNEMADDIIVYVGYVPIIFVLWTLYQIIGQGADAWSAFRNLMIHTAPIGIIILGTNAVDEWLSLKWSDLDEWDTQHALLRKARKSLLPIRSYVFCIYYFCSLK